LLTPFTWLVMLLRLLICVNNLVRITSTYGASNSKPQKSKGKREALSFTFLGFLKNGGSYITER
jgi:hypothetical protein